MWYLIAVRISLCVHFEMYIDMIVLVRIRDTVNHDALINSCNAVQSNVCAPVSKRSVG